MHNKNPKEFKSKTEAQFNLCMAMSCQPVFPSAIQVRFLA